MSFEQPNFEGESVSDQEIINALDNWGIEDDRTKDLLEKFATQLEQEANAEAEANQEKPGAANRANLKADIKRGLLYSQTVSHKDYDREVLLEALECAYQDESTADLVGDIEAHLDKLDG